LIEQVSTCAGKAAEKAVKSIATKMEERLDEMEMKLAEKLVPPVALPPPPEPSARDSEVGKAMIELVHGLTNSLPTSVETMRLAVLRRLVMSSALKKDSHSFGPWCRPCRMRRPPTS